MTDQNLRPATENDIGKRAHLVFPFSHGDGGMIVDFIDAEPDVGILDCGFAIQSSENGPVAVIPGSCVKVVDDDRH